MAADRGRLRRGRCVHRTANGATVERARRRWRIGAMAAVAAVALACMALAGPAALCLFVAGVLAGRLIEGLRNAPRPAGISVRRTRSRKT